MGARCCVAGALSLGPGSGIPSRRAHLLLALIPLVVVTGARPVIAGDTGGSELAVNTYTSGAQLFPAIAADGEGRFVIVWTSDEQDGSDGGIFGRRYASSGAALGSELQINTTTIDNQFGATVAADSAGGFVVVWTSEGQDGSTFGVFAKRYGSNGLTVGSEFQVNTYTTDYQFEPVVAVDGNGEFLVAWTSNKQDGPDIGGCCQFGIFAQRYAVDGATIGTEFQVNTYATNNQDRPAIAAAGNGDVIVVWTSQGQDDSGNAVVGQRYDNSGLALGSEFRVNAYTTDNQSNPAVAADSIGNFVVVWESAGQDLSVGGIFGQRFDVGGLPIGTEFQANLYTTGDQLRPSVAADAEGGFVVAWQSYGQEGYDSGIYARRYNNGGDAIGGEFHVNSYTTGAQAYPQVTVRSTPEFVVTWQSPHDGSDEGVFARQVSRSCPTAPVNECIEGFGKGFLLAKDGDQLTLKMLKGPEISQSQFGNPLPENGTSYRLCIYDDGAHLAADLEIDRPGDITCSGGAADCWRSVGLAPPDGKGYRYYDTDLAANGAFQLLLKGGREGKSKILLKGRGDNLPQPIAAALTVTTAVTVQLLSSDAAGPGCIGVTLSDPKRQDTTFFKAK